MTLGVASAALGKNSDNFVFKHVPGWLWYRFHVTSQIVGMALAVVGLVVALHRFDPDDATEPFDYDKHADDGNVYKAHGVVGLAVVASAVIQALLGLFREPKEAAQQPGEEEEEGDDDLTSSTIANLKVEDGTSKKDEQKPKPPQSQLKPRRTTHVVLGWIIVVLGLVNCYLGAVLIDRKLGDATAPYTVNALLWGACLLFAFFLRRWRS